MWRREQRFKERKENESYSGFQETASPENSGYDGDETDDGQDQGNAF
jgi:hypothetical protein